MSNLNWWEEIRGSRIHKGGIIFDACNFHWCGVLCWIKEVGDDGMQTMEGGCSADTQASWHRSVTYDNCLGKQKPHHRGGSDLTCFGVYFPCSFTSLVEKSPSFCRGLWLSRGSSLCPGRVSWSTAALTSADSCQLLPELQRKPFLVIFVRMLLASVQGSLWYVSCDWNLLSGTTETVQIPQAKAKITTTAAGREV